MVTSDETVLINKVRAYERAIGARRRALELAEKGVNDERLVDKRYVFDFSFNAADFHTGLVGAGGTRPRAQTKNQTVDKRAAWFVCKSTALSVAIVGSNGSVAIYYTVAPVFRPYQISGTIDIRDSFRDRAWSNLPLPDAFYANNAYGPRLLPKPARLPGGTNLSATYAPTVSQFPLTDGTDAAPNPFGITTINQYRVSLSLIGVEVRK